MKRQRMRKGWLALGALWLCLSVSACCTGSFHLQVEAVKGANQNRPIAVDLVVVYQEDVFDKIQQMNALQWFGNRAQIQKDSQEGAAFDVWSWEWVPGQSIPAQAVQLRNVMKFQAVGAVLFANYTTPGEHRAQVDPCKDLSLQLLETDFILTKTP